TLLLVFCFFQAEDGIRDDLVTGVQTCALPIWRARDRSHCERAPVEEVLVLHMDDGRARPQRGSASGRERADTTLEAPMHDHALEIGRASCRERGWRWVGEGAMKEKGSKHRSRG